MASYSRNFGWECDVNAPENGPARSAAPGAADLAAVRAELAAVEALEDEIRCRAAHLRASLSAEQFRLAWALLDAEQRRGQAERLLAIRLLTDALVRELPGHAATVRAAMTRLMRAGDEVGEVT